MTCTSRATVMDNAKKKESDFIMSSGQPASRSSNSGFSFVELLVVMVILGIITMGAIPFYSSMRDKTRSAGAMVEIRGIEKVIIAYSIDNGGRFPATLDDVG